MGAWVDGGWIDGFKMDGGWIDGCKVDGGWINVCKMNGGLKNGLSDGEWIKDWWMGG